MEKIEERVTAKLPILTSMRMQPDDMAGFGQNWGVKGLRSGMPTSE